MTSVNTLQAKSNLSRLVESLERGTKRGFVMARNGQPTARLVPMEHSGAGQRLGIAKGHFSVPDNIRRPQQRNGATAPKSQHRMNLLLDTHVALWATTDSPRPPPPVRERIANTANAVWVSVASLWEIAIKHSLGRGNMPVTGAQAKVCFEQPGYRLLNIKAAQVLAVADLPALHADPFDRLLVAQVLAEPLRLITHDPRVAHDSDTVIHF